MTIDTGSPVSFLNWATTKQILEGSPNPKFIPAERLNLSAQFVNYNEHPVLILGALKADIRSAGWEVGETESGQFGFRYSNRTDSDSSDFDIPHIEWKTMDKYIKANTGTGTSSSTYEEKPNLILFWDLIGSERPDKPGKKLELEAHSEMVSPKAEEKEIDCVYRNEGTPIIEVNLTADSPKESSPEVSVVTVRRVSHKSQKEEFRLSE